MSEEPEIIERTRRSEKGAEVFLEMSSAVIGYTFMRLFNRRLSIVEERIASRGTHVEKLLRTKPRGRGVVGQVGVWRGDRESEQVGVWRGGRVAGTRGSSGRRAGGTSHP